MYSNPSQNCYSLLTVQDIIISNPLRSVGVRELETVTLYTVVYGGSRSKTQMYMYL